MKLTKKESEHIQAKGNTFTAALAAASMEIRRCPKLIGLDKIREPLAIQAALRATGFQTKPFVVPAAAGEITEEMQRLTEDLFEKAVEAAR